MFYDFFNGKKSEEEKKIRTVDEREEISEKIAECSRMLRQVQKTMESSYQFEPCRQLCELAANIDRGTINNLRDVREDLGYAMEAFGIEEYIPCIGEAFDPRKHELAYGRGIDPRGRMVCKVYSRGYAIRENILIKAQVDIR